MPNFNDTDAMLAAYADGELDADAARQIEARLAIDPAAREALENHRKTTALLRTAFPLSLFSRDVEKLPVAHRFRIPRMGWLAAASVLLGLFGYAAGAAWPGLLLSERSRMLTEIAEYHAVYSRETVHLVEVPAAQADHLKAWLGKRVARTLVIPDLSRSGLTFAGGRLVVLDGSPVAELMYTRANGLPIAFCVVHRDGAPKQVIVENRGAINLASWADGSHIYVVVGEADPGVIGELASRARTQL